MKILLANKFYYRRGGDCIYMLNLEKLLKAHGHEVAVFAMDYPENLDTPWKKYFPKNMSKLMAFTRPFGSHEVKSTFKKLLDDFKPDVVHLNNVHTQLSPVMAELAHQRGIKVVWTLHDYKLLCPRYDCLKNGNTICETCFNGDKKACLDNKCMKGSKLASFIGFKEAIVWNRERLEASTDVFICPSQFMADKMVQGGFSKSKMQTLCNFIDVEKCKFSSTDGTDYTDAVELLPKKEDYYCFIGRLSHEKGAKTLIEAANQLPYKLVIIGGGPLMDELKSVAHTNIEFVGFKQWDDIKQLVGKARFSVIPSEWYENNPLSVIEAQCLGTPVLGANIGGIPELTDYTFSSGNIADLKTKIEKMWNSEFDYQQIASDAQHRYDAETYYDKLINIYK
ncbi:glycosyltransferase [Prevotella copri]|uniref:Glycosyltransferase n=1 Tax=Segatella copri TaxID=165179 RepID=A0AAW5U9T2_9BACT|nr:glycosyltransferase [Segatella copri]MCW4100182.1 glycosyltransferase [Segatella copri]MCW4133023.1 glycosyltransferase [Segatella copri]MCW4163578.1 glycosyltransferase [Segatella copri]